MSDTTDRLQAAIARATPGHATELATVVALDYEEVRDVIVGTVRGLMDAYGLTDREERQEYGRHMAVCIETGIWVGVEVTLTRFGLAFQ